jgi:hypothetical protein
MNTGFDVGTVNTQSQSQRGLDLDTEWSYTP